MDQRLAELLEALEAGAGDIDGDEFRRVLEGEGEDSLLGRRQLVRRGLLLAGHYGRGR